ncbi:hypothetical protein Ahy_A08g038710 isoform A [Arachis hypogaea]|uniref:Uncharacterized protein n=1 Tax=Arachis hypogaea TaxID=3818 RepID=A0A445BU64_ARAHY|nr:hypothetical protein Ahy_A08g038710 isoform A [Arachis hypogaea]
MLDPTVVVHFSKSTKTSDLTGIMPIQPKKLFHLDITREATTPPNGQSHVRVGAVLPKVINLVALMMTRIFRRRSEDPICWFMPTHFALYALSDKYTPAEVIFDFLGAYMSLKISHVIRATYLEAMLDDHIFEDDKSKVVDCSTFWPMTPFGLPTQKNRSNDNGVWVTGWMRECTLQDDFNIQINDSTRMRLAMDLVLEEYNDLCLVIQENAWQYRTKVEAEHEDI